tara:strand:+ start:1894 stop:2856 length:963 start_codon:yes stop_codon:yes gene_type:complete
MQKVAIIGAGAVGSYYGARLVEVGHNVAFLVRRDYENLKKNGLIVQSVDGDIYIEKPNVYKNSNEIGSVDWVICALKSTSIDSAEELIKPCINKNTKILVLMNGIGLEEKIQTWFPNNNIFGGLAFTCINRSSTGVVEHLDYGAIVIGHLGDKQSEIDDALSLWEKTKVTVTSKPSLRLARWEKLCWNIPFNGLTVASGGVSTEVIIEDVNLRHTAKILMEEIINTANADLNHIQSEYKLDIQTTTTSMIRRTSEMKAYLPSTTIDFLAGKEMEVSTIFETPLEIAKKFNISTPLLELLTGQMRSLNNINKITHKYAKNS